MSYPEQSRVTVELHDGQEFGMVISSHAGEIKTMYDTLPTVTFDSDPVSILDVPYIVEKLMTMHVAVLKTVSEAAKKAMALSIAKEGMKK